MNKSITSSPDVNLSLLPVENSTGSTGYPAIRHSVLRGDLIWLGRDIGAVESFSISASRLTETVVFPFAKDQKLIGLFPFEEDSVLAVSNRGDLVTWSSQDPSLKPLKPLSDDAQIQAAAIFGNYLAISGKGPKNNLKVYCIEKDGSAITPLYTAKPTMNTRLNLPFNIDIRAICFLDAPSRLAVSNADGQIFLYDFSRQTTSLSHHQVLPKKSVISGVSRADRDDCVIFTDTTGIIEIFDLSKGKSLGRFKSHEGSVQSFTLNNSILLTICKDRFLRIFSYSTRTLLHKINLKHYANTIQVANQTWLQALKEQYEDSEDEEVWEGMNKVSDKKRVKNE